MVFAFNLKNSSFQFWNLVIEGVLFGSIRILKFFNFFSIQLSETTNLIQKMSYFSIFEG